MQIRNLAVRAALEGLISASARKNKGIIDIILKS